MQSATGRFLLSLASGRTLHKVLFVIRREHTGMDGLTLRRVSYVDISALQHEVFTSSDFLVIRYAGIYRDGGAGRGDALYIRATAEAAHQAWYSPCTILDFQGLQYSWGDEMEWVVDIGWNPVVKQQSPLAIVVGDKCREALRSLLDDKYNNFCVDTMEQGVSLCQRKQADYKLRP
jgi:hypothetical protein